MFLPAPTSGARRAVWLSMALSLSGCSSSCKPAPHREVRWPASHPTSLEDELAATAKQDQASKKPPLDVPGVTVIPEATPEPPEPELPPDAPGLRATALELEGLWVAEIEIGEVEPGTPLPLVMMLHGRGDKPRVPGGPFGRVPTPMRVLVPRGPLVLGAGYAWARPSVTQGRFEELARDLLVEADRLASVLQQVRASRPTAGTPIVTGFSQGGMLAWVMAMQHPDQVGLAIPIAGWVPPGARTDPLSASPTYEMHGTDDPIVKIAPTIALVDLLRDAGNDVLFEEFPGVTHEVSHAMNAQFERWLEQALSERAPGLAGGPGVAGEDPEPVDPYDPALDVDLGQDAVPPAAETEPPAEESAAEDTPPEEVGEGATPPDAPAADAPDAPGEPAKTPETLEEAAPNVAATPAPGP